MKKTHNIELTTAEVFSLMELTKLSEIFGPDADLKTAFAKLSNVKIPEVKHNYDYELPVFNPKVIK
tara:strand:- start:1563 stop:1760 length:198 start_codon:yes stop_codon:yes gene_type:complete